MTQDVDVVNLYFESRPSAKAFENRDFLGNRKIFLDHGEMHGTSIRNGVFFACTLIRIMTVPTAGGALSCRNICNRRDPRLLDHSDRARIIVNTTGQGYKDRWFRIF